MKHSEESAIYSLKKAGCHIEKIDNEIYLAKGMLGIKRIGMLSFLKLKGFTAKVFETKEKMDKFLRAKFEAEKQSVKNINEDKAA